MPKLPQVLIVDDEVTVFLAFEKVLKTCGFLAHTAETKTKAIELLDHNNYQAVLTDLRLGESGGMEGMEIVKLAREQNPKSQIILWSAYGDEQIKNMSTKMGADYYFEKPFSITKIAEIMKGELPEKHP